MIIKRFFSALRHSQNKFRICFLLFKCKWFFSGVKIKSLTNCGRNIYISCTDGGSIIIGKGVSLSDNIKIIAQGGHIEISDNSHIGDGTFIVCKESIFIGENALIAEYVVIRDQNHGLKSDPINTAGFSSAPIVIKENVWIATKATVLKGVSIGAGAVIAAHAVVNRSVTARSIVAGIPARKVGVR